MGVLKDFLDVTKDLANAGGETANTVFNRKRYSSISKQSTEGTLQFPVIVSKSLDIETLQMVSKALERNYASFVQIAMTMSHAFDMSTDHDLAGYVRNFHQNANVKSTIDDFHNSLVSFESALESYQCGVSDQLNAVYMTTLTEGHVPGVVHANKDGLTDVLEGINEGILNDKFLPRRKRLVNTSNTSLNNYYNVKEAGSGKPDNTNITVNITNPDGGRKGQQSVNNKYELPTQVLKDNDAKKANELVPTIMHMRVRAVGSDGSQANDVDFLLGIKSTMHPVSSDEMVANINSGLRNKGKIFNFIRWTTGETAFFKDFLFNIKEMKLDVSNQSAGQSKWWMALKRRKALAKVSNNLMLPKKLLPNATMVLSIEEVDHIKDTLGYDLLKESVVDRLMKEYFLLGFVVVDNASQIVHFLFDGQDYYQSVSFTGLEKSTHNKNDMDFKDVLRLVQRV